MEGADLWGQEQGHFRDNEDAEDGFWVAAGGFEDGNAAVLFDGVGEDFLGFGRVEVVEGVCTIILKSSLANAGNLKL